MLQEQHMLCAGTNMYKVYGPGKLGFLCLVKAMCKKDSENSGFKEEYKCIQEKQNLTCSKLTYCTLRWHGGRTLTSDKTMRNMEIRLIQMLMNRKGQTQEEDTRKQTSSQQISCITSDFDLWPWPFRQWVCNITRQQTKSHWEVRGFDKCWPMNISWEIMS